MVGAASGALLESCGLQRREGFGVCSRVLLYQIVFNVGPLIALVIKKNIGAEW